MLTYLRVRNFAIIDELEVEFEQGMNVVTGETGAGKSILMDALSLVLGRRANPEVVRSGEAQAEVEALFDIADDTDVRARLVAAGLGEYSAVTAGDNGATATEHELVLRRVVQRSGRSRAYVNGRLASATQLAELSRGLADISSQHQHHTLVDPASHLLFLDAFGQLAADRERVRGAYEALRRAQSALAAQGQSARERVEREDLLRFQIREIDELAVAPGEPEDLHAERDRQRHAEKLASATSTAEATLYSSDEAVCDQLARIATELRQASELDRTLGPLAEQLASAQAQITETARELGEYARGLSLDSERLAELEERLDAIRQMTRKYGGSCEAMLEHRDAAAAELRELDRGEERLSELAAEAERACAEATAAALALSAAREKAAARLGKAITRELSSLSMGDARVQVQVVRPEGGADELCVGGARLTATGIDRVEFLIAPNRGEQPQPLGRIASGGELSRAMLAVKRVLSGLGPAGLYVFDEVDAGVGGAVAEVIGRKLKEVARHHQVICITHLPQIAVFADVHLRVDKGVDKGRTRSRIVRLRDAEQREEIARMLGGIKITDKTRAAAREMLRAATD